MGYLVVVKSCNQDKVMSADRCNCRIQVDLAISQVYVVLNRHQVAVDVFEDLVALGSAEIVAATVSKLRCVLQAHSVIERTEA
jgi:hypothetical protein